MRKIKYIILAFLFFLPVGVLADCSDKELTRYKKLAGNVSYSIEPIIVEDETDEEGETDDYASFKLTFTNLVDNLYVEDDYHFVTFKSNDGIIRTSYTAGVMPLFSIRSEKCPGTKLTTFHIKFPQYNNYYNKEICKDYQSAPVCQKWITSSISEEDIQDYIDKNTIKKEETINKKDVKGIFDYVLDYYVKYYYIAIPITIVVLVLIILIYKLYKRKKESLF